MDYISYKDFRDNPQSTPIRKSYLIQKKETELSEKMDNSRVVTFTASTGIVDRHGDIIYQSGWKLDNFLKNPVVLFGHNSDQLPIGHVSQVNFIDGNLTLSIDFVPREIHPFADTVYQMILRGDINAGSVGMKPLKWAWVESEERFGIDFIEQELLEFSIVTIPANPEAISMDNKKFKTVDVVTEKQIEEIKSGKDINIKRMANRLRFLKRTQLED